MHETTVRMMAGASPARTLQYFGRNLRKRHNTGSSRVVSKSGAYDNSPSVIVSCTAVTVCFKNIGLIFKIKLRFKYNN